MNILINAVSRALRRLFVLPIRFYQRFISPALPRCCKYYPSCSAYSVRSYEKHGIFMGTLLTAWRLLRCNPWSGGGVDHVPEIVTLSYLKPKNLGKNKEK